MNEAELILGIKSRDNVAFAYLRSQFFPVIRHYVLNNSGRMEDAEDVFEEGVVSLIEILDRPNLEMKSKVSTLLVSICRNYWLLVLEKQRAANNYQYRHNENLESEDFSDELDEEVYRNILWQSFGLLKDECRYILRAYFKEIPVKEIADIFGYSPGYLKKKKFYCHKHLVQLVSEHPDYKKLTDADVLLV